MATPVIALTVGDAAGIGPEIVLKAMRALAPEVAAGRVQPVAVGNAAALADANDKLALGGQMCPESRSGAWPDVPVIQAGPDQPLPLGRVAAAGGEGAFRAVERAVALAMAGDVAGIATAPLNKEALNLAGHKFAGHTDMLAALTGARDSCMMLAHGDLRVTHVTTHVALSRVPALLTPERLNRVLELTFDALRRLGVASPRVAVAALNPHAGEGGLFGGEDDAVTTPVVHAWRERGLDVTGPVPGDTVFVKAAGGAFDAVVAMYHDQGHIPVKLLGFRVDRASGKWVGLSGVNVTLGLPIVRTSVDHGTAFDIAGQGIANADSMVEAVLFARDMAAGRQPE